MKQKLCLGICADSYANKDSNRNSDVVSNKQLYVIYGQIFQNILHPWDLIFKGVKTAYGIPRMQNKFLVGQLFGSHTTSSTADYSSSTSVFVFVPLQLHLCSQPGSLKSI